MTTAGMRHDRVDQAGPAARDVGSWHRRAVLAVVIVAVGIAAAGLVRAATAPQDPGPQAQVDQIAATLRCPTCQGLSVADSPSQLAQGMRDIITRQLDAGRSPAEVRAWFVARYGPWIVLEPATSGLGALAWVLPVAVIAFGIVVAWHRTRWGRSRSAVGGVAVTRRRGPIWAAVWALFAVVVAGGLAANVAARGDGEVVTGAANGQAATADTPPPLGALRQATVDQPDDPQAWFALASALDQQGDLRASLRPYQRALELAADDPTVQRAATSALVRADRPEAAEPMLRDLAQRFPDDPEVLLLLGTTERALGRFGATTTLQRFVQLAPDHPAADTVRSLLAQDRQS
ncbi:cytochrome c-type biogenesis protein CcmH [soil metagenome]